MRGKEYPNLQMESPAHVVDPGDALNTDAVLSLRVHASRGQAFLDRMLEDIRFRYLDERRMWLRWLWRRWRSLGFRIHLRTGRLVPPRSHLGFFVFHRVINHVELEIPLPHWMPIWVNHGHGIKCFSGIRESGGPCAVVQD